MSSMLSAEERAWLNDYHAQVLAKIGPQLEGDDPTGSSEACAPL